MGISRPISSKKLTPLGLLFISLFTVQAYCSLVTSADESDGIYIVGYDDGCELSFSSNTGSNNSKDELTILKQGDTGYKISGNGISPFEIKNQEIKKEISNNLPTKGSFIYLPGKYCNKLKQETKQILQLKAKKGNIETKLDPNTNKEDLKKILSSFQDSIKGLCISQIELGLAFNASLKTWVVVNGEVSANAKVVIKNTEEKCN